VIGTPVFAAVVVVAFLTSFMLLCALRPVARLVRLMDKAGELKQHQGEVPLVGGLAILGGYLMAQSILPVFFEPNKFFLIASSLLVITGTLDDRFLLHPVFRLAVHVVVALTAVIGAQLVVETIGAPFFTGVIDLGWLAFPFGVLVIVGGINAWNMIDGIDGLASAQAFIALAFLLVVAGSSASSPALQASLLALLCAIGAFFLFNLPFRGLRRNRTFLGDAGSMFLGLAVVWHALILCQGGTAVMSPITALWFVALPVYDVLTTTVRRMLKGLSPLAGDRQHLHHLLQDHGLSIRQTLLVLVVLSFSGGAIGLYGHISGISDSLMFTVFGLLGTAYFVGVRRLAKALHRIGSKILTPPPEENLADGVKVSIITVCFNAADTIADTIESIRRQSHPNIEYILIDGGSTDETLAIIAENRDVISVLVTEPDSGMYYAANKGIEAATGEFVGMLNADDYYADDDVVRDVARLAMEGSDAVYGDLHYVDRANPNLIIRNWISGNYKRKSFDYGWMPPHPTFFLRKDFYDRYGLFRLDFETAADYELMLRMLYRHSLKPRYINRILVKMRVGGKSNVSFANRIKANKEDRNAWKINGLEAAWYTLYLKPLSKLIQFFN
jgi:undecaprenyl-phosphate alpha-N-acetylglucosaminyl 1-phosphatetransferase